MSDITYSNRNLIHVKKLRYLYVATVIITLLNLFVDGFSTYLIFKYYPDVAVNSEQNTVIVHSYRQRGIRGLKYGFIKTLLGWTGIALVGTAGLYIVVWQFLRVKWPHNIFMSYCLTMLTLSCLNLGAGINNLFLYLFLL